MKTYEYKTFSKFASDFELNEALHEANGNSYLEVLKLEDTNIDEFKIKITDMVASFGYMLAFTDKGITVTK